MYKTIPPDKFQEKITIKKSLIESILEDGLHDRQFAQNYVDKVGDYMWMFSAGFVVYHKRK